MMRVEGAVRIVDARGWGVDVRWMRAVECAEDRNEDARRRKNLEEEEAEDEAEEDEGERGRKKRRS